MKEGEESSSKEGRVRGKGELQVERGAKSVSQSLTFLCILLVRVEGDE